MAQNPKGNPSNQNSAPVSPRVGRVPLSKESKFIGYLVLGFGLLAIVTVLILVFSNGKENGSSLEAERKVQKLAPELMAPLPPPKKVAKQELLFKRDPNLDPARMNGEWQALIGQYTAVLQIDKNVFQVILASESLQIPRTYSSGTFKVLEDMVMLTPRRDWPKPTSSGNIQYRKLTSSPYPVIAFFDGDEMVWQNPPQSEKRVLSPRRLPLLMSQDQDAIIWKRLK